MPPSRRYPPRYPPRYPMDNNVGDAGGRYYPENRYPDARPDRYPESDGRYYPTSVTGTRYPTSDNRFPVGNDRSPIFILKYGNRYGGSGNSGIYSPFLQFAPNFTRSKQSFCWLITIIINGCRFLLTNDSSRTFFQSIYQQQFFVEQSALSVLLKISKYSQSNQQTRRLFISSSQTCFEHCLFSHLLYGNFFSYCRHI